MLTEQEIDALYESSRKGGVSAKRYPHSVFSKLELNGLIYTTRNSYKITDAGKRALANALRGQVAEESEMDFGDEEAVLAEMAAELDIDADELTISESDHFGVTVYEISLGRKEWYVVESSDQERELALEIVKQDLENEPEIFNQSFIEQHINIARLKRDLESDVMDGHMDRLSDEADRHPDDFWDEYERAGFDAPEEDDDGEREEPSQTEIEELAEHQTNEDLSDPMRYLEDMLGREDAVKKAIEIAGIDVESAAEDAVDTDGPGHFLSSYDGNTTETKSGLVYWRVN